ncbi:MAG: hypothetical protein GY941_25220 [Planctomycetes bacterium]|nr:hypothetical protein [Planctomycetota bacterium]
MITISLLFFISFLFSFIFGGITGIILANCIINTILHDSFFVVAHFHYILSLAAVYIMICSLFNYYSIITSLYLNN